MSAYKTLAGGILALVLTSTSAVATTAAMTRPASPNQLRAKATATDEALLTWADNSTNEAEFHIEARWNSTPWTDLGPIPPNSTSLKLFNLAPQTVYYFRMRAKNAAGWSAYSNETAATSWYTVPPTCAAGDTQMCLQNGRYLVQATYQRGTDIHGAAHTEALSQQSGFFWFFDASNVEALVKVLDGCALNAHQWVYASGLTDLRVLVTLVDTQTGATATYLNPGGAAFAPVTDTDALPCQ
jgi:hypothetical protein